jgi:predicted metal-dependent hydrolase
MQTQERETPRSFLDRESHFVWGRRLLLRVVEAEGSPWVELRPRNLVLHVRKGSSTERRAALVESWYRDQLRAAAAPRIDHWVRVLGVKKPSLHVQRMRTKWGTCNRESGRLRLNTWLAKKPTECLDYIVLHELAHLRVADHGPRFVAILDEYMPAWRRVRERLNRLPTGPESWGDTHSPRAESTTAR